MGDGADLCGWWFGPSAGGEMVWAYHPSRKAATPPAAEWNVPHDGAIDPTFTVTPASKGDAKRPKPAAPSTDQAAPPSKKQTRPQNALAKAAAAAAASADALQEKLKKEEKEKEKDKEKKDKKDSDDRKAKEKAKEKEKAKKDEKSKKDKEKKRKEDEKEKEKEKKRKEAKEKA